MLQEDWDKFQHTSYRISAIFALITNSILIHLIVNYSPKSLGTYKYLMTCICVFEVLYEAMDLAASPDMYTNDSAFIVIVNSKKSPFPSSMLLGINLTYCACFGTSLAIFATHFVYRYLVVIGLKTWTVRSVRNVMFWLIAPLIFGIFWGCTAWYFFSAEPILDRVLKEEITLHYGVGLEEIAYIGPYFYLLDENNKEFVNWKAIQGLIVFVAMIATSLTTMTVFGILSYLKIHSVVAKNTRSANLRSLQSQLLQALIYQTIIPLTLMHLPISICFIIPFFDGSKVIFGRFLTTSIAIYPVLDPLPNMFLIKDYRTAMKKKVMKIPSYFSFS